MMRGVPHLLTIAGLAGLTACGLAVQPRTAESPPGPGAMPGAREEPSLGDPSMPVRPRLSTVLDQVCRAGPRPRGWIAIGYRIDPDSCPQLVDDNPYTVAVIQRYRDQQIGTVLTVCADQSIPVNWMKDSTPVEGDDCLGARVAAGAPTAVVIRRMQ